jgi:hypothetical protein
VTEPRPETPSASAGRTPKPWTPQQREDMRELKALMDARFQELQDEFVRSGRKTSERI